MAKSYSSPRSISTLILHFFVLFVFVFSPSAAAVGLDRSRSCSPQRMTVYKVVVRTFWTRDLFPKHYPDWRPSAQWSKIIGQSHNNSFVLFHVGEIAPQRVKVFAETGRSDSFDEPRQGEGGVYDEFSAPPIKTGAGRSEVEFFMDGNHSRVSLMARIVPSPDWFIGVDSFDLCVDGNWIDTVTIEGDPLDAGTDNGFTFTAPNWATEPQGVVYHLTSSYPSHPAGSFFYPNLKRLPPIATFQFIKMKEYELSEVFRHSEDISGYEILQMEQLAKNAVESTHSDALKAEAREVDALAERERGQLSTVPTENTLVENRNPSTNSAPLAVTSVGMDAEVPLLPRGDKNAIMNSIVEKYRRRGSGAKDNGIHGSGLVPPQSGNAATKHGDVQLSHASTGASVTPSTAHVHHQGKMRKAVRKSRPARDCQLSSWGEWSECSRSCGIGEMQRRRQVMKHARRGGRVCPPLLETRWCGSAKPCNKNYFQW